MRRLEPLAAWEYEVLQQHDAERVNAVADLAALLLASDKKRDRLIGMAIYGAVGIPVPAKRKETP